jgi:hypothetical protein
MINLENIEHRKFCGVPIGEYQGAVVICKGEAIGDLTAELEDGTVVPVPVCQRCINDLAGKRRIEGLDSQQEGMV